MNVSGNYQKVTSILSISGSWSTGISDQSPRQHWAAGVIQGRPIKRREHDEWIAQQEQATPNYEATTITRPRHPTEQLQPKPRSGSTRFIYHIIRNWGYYATAGFIYFAYISTPKTSKISHIPSAESKPYQATSISTTPTLSEPPKYIRPKAAPNGQAWPALAGYIDGYTVLNDTGLSTIKVDNSQNDSDVFVKLVFLDGEQAFPVRQFYIPAFGFFLLDKVTAGHYDVRYRDISSGGLSRSESFSIKEEETYDGTQFSEMTLTLYKVQNGNMQTYDLAESEF